MNFAGLSALSPLSWLRRAAGLALLMLLTSCGFALKGETPLPFNTMYINIPDSTRFGADVRRQLKAASPDTRQVNDPADAEAILQQIELRRTQREVSLNAQGRVEEYELGLIFTFRLIDRQGNPLIADTTFAIYREMPYDDQIVQAKQIQKETLYRAMQQSLVTRLLRRLTAPDVHTAAQRALSEQGDPNAPVFDPNAVRRERVTPQPWNTPEMNRNLDPL
ncbi:hypothetical protein CEG14_16870 [Bordetella genomosp. 1]|uniref:LPS-assembly lipoprotein LptE n=1 Tax=Bordetella genomosp. 1 TaxID=1395607 RepID=A0A261SHX6_9BORD|nr:LPS assembly lipoprotein LptE [Bordetella genomosp. 1]MDQ8030528.1 LPS assembly lipoprotein LptE [Bordetella sp.]OZI36641.1 hypothetical protein CEG14_16870 [Bordetella genomosp. 1]